MGLRNPFTFAHQPWRTAPAMLINDVGQSAWEEINDGIAGANYGWPTTEGATTNPAFVEPPIRVRPRRERRGCAITGGAFYNPAAPAIFPAEYSERLLLRRLLFGLDPPARPGQWQQVTGLRDRHLVAGRPQGGRRRRPLLPGSRKRRGVPVRYGSAPPGITSHPASRTVSARAVRHLHGRGQRHGAAHVSLATNSADIPGPRMPVSPAASQNEPIRSTTCPARSRSG